MLEIQMAFNQKGVIVTCVIASYNEAATVSRVLDIVNSYPLFEEVIIVDDGSTDNTLEIIVEAEKLYPKLKHLRHEGNLGKTKAVVSGVEQARGNLIVLVDADLISLKHEHLDSLIAPVLESKADLTILEKASDYDNMMAPASYILTRPLGGERCFWKIDFQRINFAGTERYGLEVLMNMAYIKMNKKVLTIYKPDLYSLYQSEKNQPFIEALRRWRSMARDILDVSGVRGYMSQAVKVESDRMTNIYEKIPDNRNLRNLAIVGLGMGLSVATFVQLRASRTRKRIANK